MYLKLSRQGVCLKAEVALYIGPQSVASGLSVPEKHPWSITSAAIQFFVDIPPI